MYTIANFDKVKTVQQFGAMSNHNFRIHLSVADKKRIDSSRSHLNQVLYNSLNVSTTDAKDTNLKISEYFKSQNIEVKKDSVLAVDLILTTSPEFWGDWHKNGKITPDAQKKLDEWLPVQLEFVKKKFGENAMKLAILHLDEKTPHIHIILTPEETKTLKYKNQYGSQEKISTSLNAKRWNPAFWTKFLTQYAIANKKFGLKRPIEGSTSQKLPIKEYEKMIELASKADYTKAIHKMFNEVGEQLSMVNTRAKVEELLVNNLLPKLNPFLNSNKAMKKLLGKDRSIEYARNKALTKKLEDELAAIDSEKKSLADKKELYVEAINRAAQDSLYITDLQSQINTLNSEVKRLKQFEPVSSASSMRNGSEVTAGKGLTT
jgi:hypothetical protein